MVIDFGFFDVAMNTLAFIVIEHLTRYRCFLKQSLSAILYHGRLCL